jgi:hypothetical protein
MPSVKLSVTVRGPLERKYDAAALKKVDRAVKDWIAADGKRGVRTVHVAVDDAAAMKSLGVPAVKGKATADKVKRAIDALWARLTPDYLVLFGGHDIVPQFVVANPSYDPLGDDDKVVPTDNPYASSPPFRAKKRGSYLVPDRVVGRIPDMLVDGDPVWLADYLATAASSTPVEAGFYRDAYAICCDAWKRAGAACVEYLGKPASLLLVSPPEVDSSATAKGRLSARMHMIKCHGSPLDPQFYGQKGKAYPVALFSATLKPRLKPGTLAAAMCCYGAQVYSPGDPAATVPGEWPLASTYLRKGAPGFVGSTMIAWVGVSEMMCADWIAAGYLKGVLGGASLGQAFLEAKQGYVRWINQQGRAPDLADEKTLIEFVLLGDPSIHPVKAAAPASAVMAAGVAPAVRATALMFQERRQRRMVSTRAADQIREVLPVRAAAGRAAVARAPKVFEAALAVFKEDAQEFGLRAKPARIDQLDTRLPGPPAAARRGLALGKAQPAGDRQSIEYYWSGRRVQEGLKQIRLIKVETDPKGNVLRSAVFHSS